MSGASAMAAQVDPDAATSAPGRSPAPPSKPHPRRRRKWRRVVGAAIFLWFVGMWLWAFVSPFAWLALMLTRKYIAATLLLAVALTPYGVRVRPYRWCRAVLRRSRDYFDMCEISYPEPPPEPSPAALEPPTAQPTALPTAPPTTSQSTTTPSPPPAKPFLMCVAPHGVFCLGYVQLAIEEDLSNVRFLMARALYSAPFFNFFLLRLAGTFGTTSADEMRARMSARENLAIVPGGFHEATLHSHKVDRVYLKSRKGFIKYALRYGYNIVPVWVDGESDSYRNVWQGAWSLRLALSDRHIPGVVPFGAWFCPILPSPRTRMHIAVGNAIEMPVIEEPTDEDVNCWHAVYADAMLELQARGSGKTLEMW